MPCVDRDKIYTALLRKGVECKKYFSPSCHQQLYYTQNYPAHLPITDNTSAKILCLPHDDKLTLDEMSYMIETLKEVL